MNLNHLREIPEGTFWYCASPYTGFKGSLWEANRQVCRAMAVLAEHRVPAFSPIAHSHALCQHYPISALNHGLWMGLDKPMMIASHGLIVVKLQGWDTSKGVGEEIAYFEEAGKPIEYWEGT